MSQDPILNELTIYCCLMVPATGVFLVRYACTPVLLDRIPRREGFQRRVADQDDQAWIELTQKEREGADTPQRCKACWKYVIPKSTLSLTCKKIPKPVFARIAVIGTRRTMIAARYAWS